MIYDVSHVTRIRYASIVRLARFNLRLKPAPWPTQALRSYALTSDPKPWTVQEDIGPYIVNRSRLTMKEPLTRLTIESRFQVEVFDPGIDFDSAPSPTVAEVRRRALASRDISKSSPAAYLYASPAAPITPEIAAWGRAFFREDAPVLACGRALMAAIHQRFRYDSKATDSTTLPAESFERQRGVCQDFAHVMIVAARAQGIPAAYVSGYLRTLPPPGKPRLVGADATHAWVNLWCGEELGWVGLDPTNDAIARTNHIFTAMGRDYTDVAPLDGVFHGGRGQTMTVAVDVVPAE